MLQKTNKNQITMDAPKRPKKPLTPYFLFLKDYRDTHGQVATTAIEANKILGDKWNSLSEEEKNKYTLKAKLEKEKYEEEMKAFNESTSTHPYILKLSYFILCFCRRIPKSAEQ
jgi:high mobility group protein B1